MDNFRNNIRNRARKQEICPACGELRDVGTVHRAGKHLRPYEEVYTEKKPLWKLW